MMYKSIFSTAAMLTFGFQFCGFLLAYMLQTEVFYDIAGGLNFLLLAFLGCYKNSALSPRLFSMTCVFVASRGWLLVFLAWRAHKRKGDSRFDGVKDKFGRFLVFGWRRPFGCS